jgi:hypothetical protein
MHTKKKKLQRDLSGAFLVPRDRIELPTRGFSVHFLMTLFPWLPAKNMPSFQVLIPMHPTLLIHSKPDGV